MQKLLNKKPIAADNAVDLRASIIEAVKTRMKPLAFSESLSDSFTLWIADEADLLQVEARKPAFVSALKTALDNADLTAVAENLSVNVAPLPAGVKCDKLADGVYLQIISPEKTIISHKARIRIVNATGNGSLVDNCEKITLDSSKKKIYRIGRGKTPTMDKGYRENDIAVSDDKKSPEYDRNKYVSRKHADIVFDEKRGFCLKVHPGGSRLSGGRTQIFRDEEEIEVCNLNELTPLKSGDVIVLAKNVKLKFEVLS
ncbi:MAG: FHA domain-containing protein [Dysgonamonadaceae bacterium]|nr:FHA domain-containing protein [Dysgonamonadaceae bacterium]